MITLSTPIYLVFLYFIWYSLLGWGMESLWCSLHARHWVNRGFLHLPLCPIYGVGVLIMLLFFTPLTGSIPLFYLAATVVMSAWEYFVGWLLEATTHMKYWDYSYRRFHLKGRICLNNCLWWGVAAYLTIFWIHPASQGLFGRLSPMLGCYLAGVFTALVGVDSAMTIRQLALIRKTIARAEAARVQLELGRMELQQQLEEKKKHLVERKGDLRGNLEEARLHARQELARLEKQHRRHLRESAHHASRFLLHYDRATSPRYVHLLAELRGHIAEKRNRSQKEKKD